MRRLLTLLLILLGALPVGAQEPLIPTLQRLTVDSAAQAVPLARLGRGVVRDVQWSPDGADLAIATTLGVWLQPADAAAEARLVEGQLGVSALAFQPNGALLATGGDDGSLMLIDQGSATEQQRVTRHIYAVVAVGYSADGTALASADASGVVRVWDAIRLQERAVFQASGMPWAIALNADGSAVAVSTRAAVDVWQVGAGGDTVAHWPLPPAATTAHVPLTFADAQTLVFAQGATIYRASIGSETPETTGMTGSVYDLRADGGVVAILQNARRFEAWRLDDNTRLAQIDDPERWVNIARFSPDWTRAASMGAQGPRVRLWTQGGASDWLAGYTGPLTGLAYEATTLAAVDDAGYVTLWNPTSGGRVTTFETWGSGQPGAALAASPDGRWMAAGGDDSVVHLLDAATGAEVASLFGHIRSVTTLAFSDDSTLLATGSLDGAIHLWDVANGTLLVRLNGHTSSVTGLRFSPGGGLLASVSHDGTVRLWGVPLE